MTKSFIFSIAHFVAARFRFLAIFYIGGATLQENHPDDSRASSKEGTKKAMCLMLAKAGQGNASRRSIHCSSASHSQ